jgi:5-methylcytosine-specific restriction endonuclease McrA
MDPWKRQAHIDADYKCEDCGEEENPNRPSFQVHHKVQKSRGGTNDSSNLKLTCPRCHLGYHPEHQGREE